MPKTTYYIRFMHRYTHPSLPYEEHEYTSLDAAWEAFRLFAEPASAEMYSEIELAEYTWATGAERRIAALSF